MEKNESFDLTRFIIENVVGIVIALAIGLIMFWLTFGTVKAYDAGIYSSGFTEISFIVGVVVASALFGSRQKDLLYAGVLGFIIGLLTSLLEGFVLKLFWPPMTIQFIMGYWGNPIVLLVFFGVIASVVFFKFFSGKESLP